MNFTEKFYNDLEGGELGEKVFAYYMNQKNNYEIIKFNKDIKYDILMRKNGKDITFEIKTDRYEYLKGVVTDNIFVEVRCSNKPSGIMATEADIFVYFFPDQEEAYVIKCSELRTLLQTRPDLFRRAEQSGDGGRVIGYLINKRLHRSIFNICKIEKHKCWN